MGVTVLEVDANNIDEIAKANTGVGCVVSALAGLGDVIVDLQKRILVGAIQAGVPRFISSDFCTDYNDLVRGENRNFDLRREFKAYLDSTSIKASSIFNGAFADILKYNTPVLNFKDCSIGYWGEKADWKLDFTTMDDTAAFTAEVALDDNSPRDLQIASFQISPNMLWADVKEATGQEFNIYQLSSLEDFARFIKKQRANNPAGESELYAKWQQGQYMYSMFTTQHNQDPLEKLSGYIDFEYFRKPLKQFFNKGSEPSKGGRPAYDYVLMFKILILQRYYNLSDDSIEYAVLDRLSFMRFLGLGIKDSVPDAKTIWLFRDRLIQGGMIEKLFNKLDSQLDKDGIIVHSGKLVDATIVEVPVQRNSREENKDIKEGKVHQHWEGNDNQLRQKDTDAQWVTHNGKDYFGYKDHIKADEKTLLVTKAGKF